VSGYLEKFAVLGSNSFSGSHFVRAALLQDAQVVGLSRSPEPHAAFLPYRWDAGEPAGRFRFHQADLNHDLDRIIAILEEFQPAYIVNFAAQSMVAESWQHPEQWYLTNVVANVKLHERLRRFDFLKKYVHVSTPEVYGSCRGKVEEDTALNPSTPYAASRAACDLHLATFHKQYGFPVAWTRAANVYGPGQQLYRIIPRTILYVKLGRTLQLHGGGHSTRSFIHIRDVAQGTLRVARDAPSGEIYHFSTPHYVSIRQVIERICRKLNVEFEEAVEVVEDRPGKDAAYLLDSSKARTTLGWMDTVSLDEGIEQTIEWVNKNWEELKALPSDYIHKP
jgi:dTDP-glucose 4,6-dehydratase